jgi:hypothetical protein
MFTSKYQLVQEPRQAGVSIYCCTPGTHEVRDIIRTPVTVSSKLIKLFNAAPDNDRAALDWGLRADARDATRRLFNWLRESGTTSADIPRFSRVIRELAERVHQAYTAYQRLGYDQGTTAIRLKNRQTVSYRPLPAWSALVPDRRDR